MGISWVIFGEDAFEAFTGDVGVDLCGGDVGVSEHFLYGEEVCAVGEEVCGEGVSELVGGNFLLYSSGEGEDFEIFPESLPGHGGASACDEEVGGGVGFGAL